MESPDYVEQHGHGAKIGVANEIVTMASDRLRGKSQRAEHGLRRLVLGTEGGKGTGLERQMPVQVR